jgi:uncharacterized protein YceK
MKRILALVLIAGLVLAGCGTDSERTDGEKFYDAYGVADADCVVYVSSEDLVWQLTHGTHVVLIGEEQDADRGRVAALIAAVQEHSGMAVYYLPKAELAEADQQAALEAVSYLGKTAFGTLTVIFVKDGEAIAVLDEDTAEAGFSDACAAPLAALDELVDPGCGDC